MLVSIGGIAFEAIHRLFHPEPLPGKIIAWVAGAGIIINATSALLFFRNKDSDINIKSAYLHLVSDALVSAGIVIGGLVMFYTQWFWMDSFMSIIIALIILVSTWRLLKESLRLSLDGVPESIHLEEIKMMALKITGVISIHHIHIWAISSTENAMTAHVVMMNGLNQEQVEKIKHELKHQWGHRNIQHITIETECESDPCQSEVC